MGMLLITMGDPNGVGPEILLKAYQSGALTGEFVAVGDSAALEICADALGISAPVRHIQNLEDYAPGALNLLDMGLLASGDIQPGQLSAKAGAASIAYVQWAAKQCLLDHAAGMVTLPINKAAVQMGIPGFTGHTEFIAGLCGQKDYTMMLSSPTLRVTHVNTHVSMADVLANTTAERVATVIELTHQALAPFIPRPKIAVAGLNCHAGEEGLFGREDMDEIAPAIALCQNRGIDCTGPFPPDTIFLRASKGEFDCVVAIYHDQGHIPIKLLGFEDGVNTTLGLKVIRTSVDHGTAFDIAYQGIASTKSLLAAYQFAEQLIGRVSPAER